MSATTLPTQQLTLWSVLNVIIGAVGGWVWVGQVQRDVGQLLMHRAAKVREMWLRFEAGKLRRRPAKAAVAAPTQVEAEAVVTELLPVVVEKQPRAKKLRLPYRHGWLLRLMGYHAAYHTNQLRELLEQPSFGAFLEEFPHVAQRLRPICRAFAVDTVLLRLPRKVRVPKPFKPRVRKPSYIDIPYRCGPDWEGREWVMRKSRRGLRFLIVKK